jgi:hypothetical protein
MISQKQIIGLLLFICVGWAFSWLLDKVRDIVVKILEQNKKFKNSYPSESDNKTEAGIHPESDNKSDSKKI